MRADFNVPLRNGEILDDYRIRKTLPTIQFLRERRAKIILMSHLGDPGGKHNPDLSMDPIQERLSELLGTPVQKAEDCVGQDAKTKAQNLNEGEVLLLENLRFFPGEERNDSSFCGALAELADLYVNDAFGTSHRAHASLTNVPLPSFAGLLMEEEIRVLSQIKKNPRRPFILIVGGTKVESKTAFLKKMIPFVDKVLVGNPVTKEIRQQGFTSEKLLLAVDGIPEEEELDIGPKTKELFVRALQGAGTVVWSAPLGQIEDERFQEGSLRVAQAVLASGAFTVAGGGNLGGFLGRAGLRDRFSHASTGGGAMLAFLAGEKMPGIEALESEGIIRKLVSWVK